METVKQQTTKGEDCSPSATLGDDSQSQTKGEDCSPSATLGKDSKSQTEGWGSPSATLGDDSQSKTEGQNSIACAFGEGSKVKAKDGFIVIAEYHYNKEEVFELKKIHTAKVGEKILGVTIEPDKYYGFDEKGKFRMFTEKEVYIFKKLIKMIKEKEE